MRALLVEDDVQTGKNVELMLRSLGHDCDWVERGEAGVILATTENYDVILLDIMLPGIDGYEVLQQLHQANVDTPVILQTGLVERDAAIQGLGLGVTDYLIKPYGKAEIAARIEAVIERAQHRASSKIGQSQPGEGRKERRRSARISVVKSGQIIYRAATCVMDCVILDLSDHGAALQPEAPHRLPESFRLKIHHGSTHDCTVCWRYRNKLGVRFLDS
jgi:DNA-binding response OmpR family regulator